VVAAARVLLLGTEGQRPNRLAAEGSPNDSA